jgi:glucosylglycerate synthase
VSAPEFRLDDDLWVRTVYAVTAATRLGPSSVEHLAGMFVPLYLWRASAFMAHTAHDDPMAVQSRLDSLCQTFQRLKPVLVGSWSAER